MSNAPDISVVAPLLDEAGNVEELVDRICAVLDERGESYEIVLVDDGSTDDTAAVLRRLEAAVPAVRPFELARNFGQAAALACGLAESRGSVVVTIDADLQNPPEEIPKLLDAIAEGAYVATGDRSMRHETTWRWLGSRFVHWTARLVIGTGIRDFGGQFKAYRREVVNRTFEVWAPGKPFFPLALWLGYPVTEVAVRHEARLRGASRYTFASLVRVNLDLISSFTTIPLIALGAGGALAAATGAVALLAFVVTGRAGGFGSIAALVLFAVGAVVGSLGIVGVYLARIYRLLAGGAAYVVGRRPLGESRALPGAARLRAAGDRRSATHEPR